MSAAAMNSNADLVAHEPGRAVDQVDASLEAILEVDLVSFGDGDAIGDDDHGSAVAPPSGCLHPRNLAVRTEAV